MSSARHRRRRMARWTFVVVVAATMAASCAPSGGPRNFRATGPPRPLPAEGQLRAASGDTFEGMLVGVRGRPVVVNVWASWCGPCRVEAPLLQRAAHRRGGDVVFLGVDSRDEQSAARAFLRRYKIRYANIFDGSGEIRYRLRLRGFPTTYIFDRRGKLVATVVGGISEQTLAAQLGAVLRR